MKNSKAFTLAEVLITLTIIGVIAALTIPNLMQKWEDQHTVSAVKEAYSILNNAVKLAVRENGPTTEWRTNGTWFITQELSKHLKYRKMCQANTACLKSGGVWYKNLHGKQCGSEPASILNDRYNSYDSPKIILNNNMLINIISNDHIRVDINGEQKPNRYGYDAFFFEFTSDGIQPYNISNTYAGTYWCNIVEFSNKNYDGLTCSTYIMKNGNVDYKYK